MKISIFIVVFLFMVRPVLPVLDYALNYNYISTVLCVNKAKPMMHCNGKCHLMKELAKAAEQEKPLSDKKTAQPNAEVLFIQALPSYNFTTVAFSAKGKKHIPYHNNYSYLYYTLVAHPPSVIS